MTQERASDNLAWRHLQLSDVAEFSNGANFTKEVFGRGIKIIGVRDFQDHLSPVWPKVDEVQKSAVSSPRHLLKEGDLLFVRSNGNRDLVGRSMLVTEGPEATHSAFTIRARPDRSLVIPRFLAYQMRYAHRTGRMLTATGTNITNLNQTILGNVPVLLPSIPLQERIVSVLAAYDELIENNLRQIEVLETMIEAIYREWFVHSRFPGSSNDRGNKGTLPPGWIRMTPNELLVHHIGGGWGKGHPTDVESEEAVVIRGTDMPKVELLDIDTCPRRFHKPSSLSARLLEPRDVVMEVSGGSDSYPVGRSVFISPQLLEALGGRAICASFCKLLRVDPHVLQPELFFLQLQSMYVSRSLKEYEVRSTGITNFKFKPFLEQHSCFVPPKALQATFMSVASPFFNATQVLGLTVQNLRKTRDLLLPKLVSGEVDVSKLDIDGSWLAA